ncbi:MAG: 2-hydroxyacyl-CoA dehydratase family protein [Chloroflexota bacterium]
MSTSYARYLEHEITKLQRRIKAIKDNPDPTKLKSNLLLYEMELDENIGQLEDFKTGKPFAYGYPSLLLWASEFTVYGGHMSADRTAQGEGSTRYLDSVRDGGWPELACDRTTVVIVLVTSGDYPKPGFVSVCNFSCEFAGHNALAMAHLFKVPYFVVDIGNDCDEENLKYVSDQLAEEVKYIESAVPGAKYDEERLARLQHYDREGARIARDVYEFRKRRPSPVNPRDAQREAMSPARRRKPEKALAYLKAQRDEIFERAENGIGVMAEEKLRLMWCTVGINYDESIYRWLEQQGVALYYVYGIHTHQLGLSMGFYGDPWNGRRLTPLEEEARYTFYNSWNGRGQRLIDDWMYIIKDQGIDGVVYPLQPGCLPVLNLRKVFADAVEQVGVPTLGLEIRGIFREGYNQQDVKTKLANFIEVCLERKRAREAQVVLK